MRILPASQVLLLLTFKALNGSTVTGPLSAPCSLTDVRTLTCKYTVTAGDVGKAASGLRFDANTSLSGGGTMGKDGKTAPISQGFGGGSITIGGTKF